MSVRPPGRAAAVGCAVAVLLSACSATGSSAPEPGGTSAPASTSAVDGSAREDVPSALDQPIDDPSLPDPLVDPQDVVSGGPPPDGIPPVDEPVFIPAGDVDFLAGDEPVVAIEVGGEHRAYPVQIMIWHEIVNDEIAGTPVSVTYCPLCNSALAFDRRLGDRLFTFGTSGMLYRSDLVMYDRQTESLWSQLEGRAIAGHLTGEVLDRIPVQTVAWDQWLRANPDGPGLSRDTGADRDYGRNPYVGYDEAADDPFLFSGDPDPRLLPKERVLGLGEGDEPTAVVLAALAEVRVLDLEVGGRPVVAWAVPGLRSALDTSEVDAGREVAASGVFDPVVDGEQLTFSPEGPDTFADAQTGSTWDVLGRAVQGPLAGEQLDPVGHVDTFWFAWGAFHPDTRVLDPGD